MIHIRKAQGREAQSLSKLAMYSKAYWGYSDAFMQACRNELLVTEEMIKNKSSYYAVAEEQGELVGFYSLEGVTESSVELGLLFVEPKHIGLGIGRKLIEHAKNHAKVSGGVTLYFQGDPNAEGFYRAVGATITGKQESSSIPGRFIPTFSIPLTKKISKPTKKD